MTVHASPSACSGARRALLIGCAVGGLCVAAGQVDAQAFNANPKTVAGVVVYDRATPGVETVTVESDSAIINWVPNVGGNPIVFLPQGNVATFTNGSVNTDFVVLNRILTTTPIRFDGTVISQIQDAAIGTTSIGGTVLFSSPGGIIIGANALFDVGSLVLTTLNVVDDGTGNFYDPAAQQLLFNNGAATPNAAIITEPGARIRALNEGSFVAMIAPRIIHGGSVRVNGSAAYVAGEQVQLRVNQGLFDIIVDTGSNNAVPIIHTGSTGGPASLGAGDAHGIYMVAMPKNQAITAILQGNVGFDPAINAAVENGVIVLSAGFNVVGGQVDRYGDFSPAPKPGPGASFEIRGGTISSDLFGYAATDMLASGQASGSLAFQQDVSLFAGRRAHLFAGASQIVTVAGNAVVSAARLDTANPAEFDLTGGEALIFAAQGGSLTIAGNVLVDASGRGIVDQVNSRAGNGAGGTAGIFADGGTVQIGGATSVFSTGTGGTIDFAPDQGGDGTGGTAFVEGRNGGSVQIGGTLSVDASGIASRENGLGPVPVTGATGTGGNVSISAIGGGSVTVGGAAEVTASGSGGDVLNGPGNGGGTGQGGNISILAGGAVTFAGSSVFAVNAFGGLGPNGGQAVGGRIIIDATAGQIDFLGDAVMVADATGGDGSFVVGGTGGSATGGDILIRARSGAAASRIRGGAILLSAQGIGGAGANGVLGKPAGRGGDGRGGNVDLLAEAGNGTVQFGAVTASANGGGGLGGNANIDGDGGRGGDGFGGTVRAGTIGGAAGSQPTGGAQFASLGLGATALGGRGGGGGGAGGNAVGGATSLLAAGIPTNVAGAATLTADATGGAGGDPVAGGATGATGLADGGAVIIAATAFGGSAGTLTAGNVTGSASATGAVGTGNSPGEWHVTASGGSSVNLANLTLAAPTTGTPAVLPFSSLEALGGTINVTQVAALSTPGEIRVIADGAGRISGATLNLAAGRDVIITHSNRGAGFTIDVGALDIQGVNVTASPGSASRASGRLSIAALGNVSVGGQVDGREIVITSSAINVASTGAVGTAATTDLTDIRATGNATVAGQILGRSILINSAAIDVAATGAIGGATTDLTDIRTTGNAMVAGQILGRNILLASNLISVGATGAIGGAATDRSELRALGNVAVAGRILGRNIQIGSSDIDIAATGSIGDAGTQVATLLLNTTGQLATLGARPKAPATRSPTPRPAGSAPAPCACSRPRSGPAPRSSSAT